MLRSRSNHVWWGALLVGAVSIAVFLLSPRDSGWQVAAYFVPLVLSVGLLAARVRGSRPSLLDPQWLLLLAHFIYAITTLVWYLKPVIFGQPLSFPSLVDGAYFLAFASYAGFLIMVLRRRSRDRTVESRIAITDASILTVSMSAVLWIAIIGPNLSNSTSWSSTTVAVLYPAFTLVMFAPAARLAAVSGVIGSAPGLLLLVWIVAEMAGDTFYGFQSVTGTFEYGAPLTVTWMVSYTALAALAAHPGTAKLLAKSDQGTTSIPAANLPIQGRLGRHVQLLILLAAAVVPVILASVHSPRSTFLLACAVVSVTLVTLRTSLLAGDLHMERQLTLELDSAVAQLVRNRDQLASQAQEMERLAFHDTVTGLGNRALLRERAALVTERLDRAALLLLDLDRFKEVNDTLGHAAGDALLLQVGDRLGGCVRSDDTVVRLGGDEFALLLPDTGSAAAILTAERVLSELREPFSLNRAAVQVRGSIGIAFGAPAADLDEMLRNADLAMYEAKADGRDQTCTFDLRMFEHATERMRVETELRAAINSGDISVYYQPIVRAVSGDVCAVEALVRWDHRARGVLPPSEFLPAAERTGLILEIGRFVLRTACEQVVGWRQDWPELCVAVNVAHRELLDPGFTANVIAVLDSTGLPAHALHLEVTETVLAVEENIVRILAPLVAIGVRFSIDDFGTGNSSLSRLRRLTLNRLKIDKSFIAEISEGEPESAPLLNSIISLAHSVGHVVVAEGVETLQQVAFLTAHGCDELQGYFFSRPVAAGQTAPVLRAIGSAGTVAGAPGLLDESGPSRVAQDEVITILPRV